MSMMSVLVDIQFLEQANGTILVTGPSHSVVVPKRVVDWERGWAKFEGKPRPAAKDVVKLSTCPNCRTHALVRYDSYRTEQEWLRRIVYSFKCVYCAYEYDEPI